MADGRARLEAPPRVVFALLVIGIGLWWTAANLGWAPPVDFAFYWPVVFIVIGLTKLASAESSQGRVLGGVFTLFGAWIMLDRLYNIPIHIDDWWPVLLILWGVLLLRGGRRRSRAARADVAPMGPAAGFRPDDSVLSSTTGGAFAGGTGRDDAITAFAVWSGARRRSASATFRRADLTAVMGGVELDLRQASTATGEAVVEVFVMWGGVNIRVPADWTVSNEVVAIMGGTDDRSTGTQSSRHRLVVKGVVLMGGVEIKT